MLEDKILGIFLSLDYDSFTITELSKLTNSKKDSVKLSLYLLIKRGKVEEVKKKFKLSK